MKEYVRQIATNTLKINEKNEIKYPITEMVRKTGQILLEMAYLPIKLTQSIGVRRSGKKW